MIHHHPPPTRGCAMKFIRRSDLEPQTRIDIVMLAWQGQGIYGKMTQLARAYHQKRREAPAFMPGRDRRWARWAQCPRAQQDPRSTRALNGRGNCREGSPGIHAGEDVPAPAPGLTGRFIADKSPPGGAVPPLYSLSLSHSVRRADAASGADSCSAALIQQAATARAPHGSPLPLPA